MSDTAAQRDLPAVRDFPDRLPPMVVKELRQGLRAKLFGETVAGFHLVVMVLLLPALTYGEASEVAGIQRLLWWVFTAVLVLLLPLRGLSALIQERRENTLDTLLLTNLSAGRVVWGKWLAIASQIGVTGLSLVPYAIIMYAAGGVSLTESLTTLLRLVLLAAALTAAYVALSWNASWLWRAGPALILTWLALTRYAGPLVQHLTGGEAAFWGIPAGSPLAEIFAAAFLIYFCLETSAARLAPWSEDHHTGPRLAGLALPLLAAVPAGPGWQEVLGPVALAGLTLVSLTALTEPWPGSRHASRTSPGKGRDRWRGLPPGWPHGVWWAVMAWGMMWWVTGSGPSSPLGEQTLRLAFWLFSGRLLLFLFPASLRNQATGLMATALVFFILQTLLSLAGDLLGLPGLTALASALPGWFNAPGTSGVVMDREWMTAATAGSCALLAAAALLKHRSAGKEAAP